MWIIAGNNIITDIKEINLFEREHRVNALCITYNGSNTFTISRNANKIYNRLINAVKIDARVIDITEDI